MRVQVSAEQMMGLMQYAFTRLDGAWFLSIAKSMGVEKAWQMDVDAWTQFSYLFGKKVRKEFIPDPVWPDSFIETIKLLAQVLKIEGREINVDDDIVTITVTECETQQMIAKAGVADCGIVTLQTYNGIIRGLFAGEIQADVEHRKNLNRGDDCCEVVISRKI